MAPDAWWHGTSQSIRTACGPGHAEPDLLLCGTSVPGQGPRLQGRASWGSAGLSPASRCMLGPAAPRRLHGTLLCLLGWGGPGRAGRCLKSPLGAWAERLAPSSEPPGDLPEPCAAAGPRPRLHPFGSSAAGRRPPEAREPLCRRWGRPGVCRPRGRRQRCRLVWLLRAGVPAAGSRRPPRPSLPSLLFLTLAVAAEPLAAPWAPSGSWRPRAGGEGGLRSPSPAPGPLLPRQVCGVGGGDPSTRHQDSS